MQSSQEYLESLSNEDLEGLFPYILKRFSPSYIACNKTFTDAFTELFSHPSSIALRRTILRDSDHSTSNPPSATPNYCSTPVRPTLDHSTPNPTSDHSSSVHPTPNPTSNRSSSVHPTPNPTSNHSSSVHPTPNPTSNHSSSVHPTPNPTSNHSTPNPASGRLSPSQPTSSKNKEAKNSATVLNILKNLRKDSPVLSSVWKQKEIFPTHRRPGNENDHKARHRFLSDAKGNINSESELSPYRTRAINILQGNEQDFIRDDFKKENPRANNHIVNQHLSKTFDIPIKSFKAGRTLYTRYLSMIAAFGVGSINVIGDYGCHHTNWIRLAQKELDILTEYIYTYERVPGPEKGCKDRWMYLAWSQNWSAARALAEALLLTGMSYSSINEGTSLVASIICHYVWVDEKRKIHDLVTTGLKPMFSGDKSEPMSSKESREKILKLYESLNPSDDDEDPSDDDEDPSDDEEDHSTDGEVDYHFHSPAEDAEHLRGSDTSATYAAHILTDMMVGQHIRNSDISALSSQHVEDSSNLDSNPAEIDDPRSELISGYDENTVNDFGKRLQYGGTADHVPKRQRANHHRSFGDTESSDMSSNFVFSLDVSADNPLAPMQTDTQTQSHMARDGPNRANRGYNSLPPGVFLGLDGTKSTRLYTFNMESPTQITGQPEPHADSMFNQPFQPPPASNETATDVPQFFAHEMFSQPFQPPASNETATDVPQFFAYDMFNQPFQSPPASNETAPEFSEIYDQDMFDQSLQGPHATEFPSTLQNSMTV